MSQKWVVKGDEMDVAEAKSRSKGQAKLPIRDRVVAEIVEALIETSGAAHQNVIIERIAVRRGEPATETLAKEIVSRFEAHLKARRRRGSPLMRRAFGEGSRRWMLEPCAYALFERPAPQSDRVARPFG